MSDHPAAWMFEDWLEGSMLRQFQLLSTAQARLAAIFRLQARAVEQWATQHESTK